MSGPESAGELLELEDFPTVVTGTVSATNEITGELATRAVRFPARSSEPWTEIADHAFYLAFPTGSWMFDDDTLRERALEE